jgi:NTP pyrophosphatase (non-canonical NTP hydrolase)
MSAAPRTGDALRDLAESTLAFYARFDYTPDAQSTITNFNEEVYELVEAALEGDKAHAAEECADVIVTALGVCFAQGLSVDEIIAAVYQVADKNDAKTHETHVLKDGKIRRRVRKD